MNSYLILPQEIYKDQVKTSELLHLLNEHLTYLERTVVLGLMNGLTYQEISHLTGVGNKTINNALRREKGKLKPFLVHSCKANFFCGSVGKNHTLVCWYSKDLFVTPNIEPVYCILTEL
jgi:hypothetical protein